MKATVATISRIQLIIVYLYVAVKTSSTRHRQTDRQDKKTLQGSREREREKGGEEWSSDQLLKSVSERYYNYYTIPEPDDRELREKERERKVGERELYCQL